MSGKAFDARAEARRLVRSARHATLATLDAARRTPYPSLASVATDIDGAPLILISTLAVHTTNLAADPAAGLLFADIGEGDPLVHPRVSVAGRFARTGEERVRRRFLARHPEAEMYASFADFSFWRMEVEGAHLVAGFGRIVDLAPADLILDLAGAQGIAAAEEEAVAHVNADHADAVRLYATRLLGLPDGAWRLTGLDPEGCDLALGDATARLLFPSRIDGPGALRRAFQELSARARDEGAGG
jgi:hypothetical protein